jgi:hypothetical protein
VTSFAELPAADQEAIGKTLLTLLQAFRDRDAEPLLAVYSDDADWVNAFGTVNDDATTSSTTCAACSPTRTSIAASWPGRRRRVSRC